MCDDCHGVSRLKRTSALTWKETRKNKSYSVFAAFIYQQFWVYLRLKTLPGRTASSRHHFSVLTVKAN